MSEREFLARQLVTAFNLNGPDFDHVSDMHRAAAYRMADVVERRGNEAVEVLKKVKHWLLTVPEPGTYGATTLLMEVDRALRAAPARSTDVSDEVPGNTSENSPSPLPRLGDGG